MPIVFWLRKLLAIECTYWVAVVNIVDKMPIFASTYKIRKFLFLPCFCVVFGNDISQYYFYLKIKILLALKLRKVIKLEFYEFLWAAGPYFLLFFDKCLFMPRPLEDASGQNIYHSWVTSNMCWAHLPGCCK